MRILLFGHTYQPSRSEQIRHVLQTLSRTEAELVAHGDFYDFLSKEFPDVCHRIGEIDCRGDYTADMALDRKSTRLNSSHNRESRMPSSA